MPVRLVDLSDQKRAIVLRILIYMVLFLSSGFLLYKFMIFPEIGHLRSARSQKIQQQNALKSKLEKMQSLGALSSRVRKLEGEVSKIEWRLFGEDEVLDFLRSLPHLAGQTGNILMSMTPSEARQLSLGSSGKSANSQGAKKASASDSKTIPCTQRPVELSVVGKYGEIVSFFEELEKLRQFMTVSDMSMSTSTEDPSEVNARFTLNLIQIRSDMRAGSIRRSPYAPSTVHVAKQTPVHTSGATSVQPGQSGADKVSQQATVSPVQTTKQPRVRQASHIVQAGLPASGASKAPTTTVSRPQITNKEIHKVPLTTQSPPRAGNPPALQAPSYKGGTPQKAELPTAEVSMQAKPSPKKMQYIVRLGIFAFQQNAENLANLVRSQKYESWTKPKTIEGKTTYHVFVGMFDTRDQADQAGKLLQAKLPNLDGYVVRGVRIPVGGE